MHLQTTKGIQNIYVIAKNLQFNYIKVFRECFLLNLYLLIYCQLITISFSISDLTDIGMPYYEQTRNAMLPNNNSKIA